MKIFIYVYTCIPYPYIVAMASAVIDWSYANDDLKQMYIPMYTYPHIDIFIHIYAVLKRNFHGVCRK